MLQSESTCTKLDTSKTSKMSGTRFWTLILDLFLSDLFRTKDFLKISKQNLII